MLSPMKITFQNAANRIITEFSGFTGATLGKTQRLRLDAFRPNVLPCPRLDPYTLAHEKRCP